MKNTLVDRITIGVYEEIVDDMILKQILDRQCTAKYRGQKIKEIVMMYFRQNNADLVAKIESELTGKAITDIPVNDISAETSSKSVNKNKKSKLDNIKEW